MNHRAIAIAIFCSALSGTRSLAAEPIVVEDRVCLFLDDRFVAGQTGLTRTWHQGKPAATPAIAPDPNANEDWPHLFGSVFYDPQDKLYKMYYESVAFNDTASLNQGNGFLRYAESSDGKSWTKPKLDLFEFNGNRENNIVLYGAELPNVFIDPNATDLKARIKMVAWCRPIKTKDKYIGGLCLLQSPDGRQWEPLDEIVHAPPSDDTAKGRGILDTNQIIWDPLGKRYYGTFRSFPSHPGLPGYIRDPQDRTTFGVLGGHRRAVAVTTSSNLLGPWPASQTVLKGDANDDEKATLLSTNPAMLDYCELYIMPTFVYGNHYLGMVSLLFFVEGIDNFRTAGDVQFTFSHDGMQWHRQPDRQTFVGPSPDGLVPCYAQCNEPLMIGDEMWIYYSEADAAHPKIGDKSQIRGASWRRDGFVSLDAGEAPASLTTHPLKIDGSKLIVNAKMAEGGKLRVAVLDEEGRNRTLYNFANCDAISGDQIAAEVTWNHVSNIVEVSAKPVRLRFELSRGSLYSFRGAP